MTWTQVSLIDLSDEPPEPPELCGLVYRSRRHWWSGPPGCGKTAIAYAVVLEAVRAGWRVAIVDFEMGARDAKTRLRELGATDEELEQIDFYDPTTKPTPADLAAVAERAQLVVIDAAAGAFDLSGLDENRDAEKFNTTWVNPLWKAGATTIVLDHVVKNTEARGMFASGHHRKIGGTEVHLGFETKQPLRRGHTAYVKVTAHKDRAGFHRNEVGTIQLVSDPATHAITWAWKEEADDSAGGGWRPTGYMEKVSLHIERQRGNRNAIFNAIGGNKKYVLEAIGFLISDGYAEEVEPGKKGTDIVSKRAYREPGTTTTVPAPTDTQPDPTVPEPSHDGNHQPMPLPGIQDNGSTTVPERFPEPSGHDGSGGSAPLLGAGTENHQVGPHEAQAANAHTQAREDPDADASSELPNSRRLSPEEVGLLERMRAGQA